MAKPKEISWGDHSGISIEYIKSRDTFYVSGWYDTFVGIEGHEISRAEFEDRLGIPPTAPRSVAGTKEVEG